MWTFNHSNGRMFRADGQLLASGYAGGNCGKNPEGINNHAMQHVRAVGPLPVGFYDMVEMIPQHPRLGPYVIVLEPDSGNEMFGRSAFRIHGDTTEPRCASEGCIILPRWARLEMWNSSDKRLQVIATADGVTV